MLNELKWNEDSVLSTSEMKGVVLTGSYGRMLWKIWLEGSNVVRDSRAIESREQLRIWVVVIGSVGLGSVGIGWISWDRLKEYMYIC